MSILFKLDFIRKMRMILLLHNRNEQMFSCYYFFLGIPEAKGSKKEGGQGALVMAPPMLPKAP